jgi:hypothetical protein
MKPPTITTAKMISGIHVRDSTLKIGIPFSGRYFCVRSVAAERGQLRIAALRPSADPGRRTAKAYLSKARLNYHPARDR